jgi:phage terminase large subunit GpA
MKEIISTMREAIAAGLKRRTMKTCSRWAENCVIMGGNSFPGPIRWDHYPWLRDMHDSEAKWNIGQKSAQMGYTVVGMNRTFYHIDVHQRNCLYLLPTKTPDATDFSSTRFDPLLELSPHLNKLFSDVKNVATKRAGAATLYIRGANSRSGLKSIPVSFIVFDEYDEMNQDNIPLAVERTSGQLYKQFWAISTPTVPEHGINKLFLQSTQEHFFFPCPLCQRLTELIYPDCLVICGESLLDPDIEKSHLICKECKGKLEHKGKPEFFRAGQWVPMGQNDQDFRGFYINQMYSPTIEPVDLAKAFFASQSDPSAEQEFHNSKMGQPHVVDGARVDDQMISDAISKSKRRKEDAAPLTKHIMMGVDVGKFLHVEISAFNVKRLGSDINVMSDCDVLWEGSVLQFEELDRLMHQWQIHMCVIDQGPERRKAYEFACRFWGHVKLCYFGTGLNGKMLVVDSAPDTHKITVDRTSWLDIALGRFHNRTITLPVNTSQMYKEQIKSPVRIYKKDSYGNPVGDYISVSKNSNLVEDSKNAQDHFGFARCYCEIALPLGASLMTNKNIESFL